MYNRSSEKWLIFLDIPVWFKEPFVAAQDLGLSVLHITKWPSRLPGVLEIETPTFSTDYLEQIIIEYQAHKNILGIWNVRDWHTPLVSQLNHAFFKDAQFPNPDVTNTCKNKVLFRRALDSTQLNPSYTLLGETIPKTRPFDNHMIVLKPSLGYGSIGVELVRPEQSFEAAFTRSRSSLAPLTETVSDLNNNKLSTSLLCEKFISGEEYSVEVFLSDGEATILGICEKAPMVEPYFEEIAYILPAQISDHHTNLLSDAAQSAAKVLDIRSGIAHMEFKIEGNHAYILDVGLRIGGNGLTHKLLSSAYGMNVTKAVLSELIGQPPKPFLEMIHTHTTLLYLFQIKGGGVIKSLPDSIEFQDENIETLEQVNFYNPGDTLTGYPNHSGLPGYALFEIQGDQSFINTSKEAILRRCSRELSFTYA